MKKSNKLVFMGVFLALLLVMGCGGGYEAELEVGTEVEEEAQPDIESEDEDLGEEMIKEEEVPGGVAEEAERLVVEEEAIIETEDEKAVEVVVMQLNLQQFYGRWETEEGTSTDKIIMDVGRIEAAEINNSEEGFDYIRFGYEASEFFPRNIIKEIEKRGSDTAYSIITIELEGDFVGGSPTLVETDVVYIYDIELLEGGKMLLTYISNEGNTEFYFVRQ